MNFIRCVSVCLIAAGIVPSACVPVYSQPPSNHQQNSKKKIYADEYSDFDSDNSVALKSEQIVKQKLEHARQWYLSGLGLIERKDTVAAGEYFEEAMQSLNDLASYPGIERNEDFIDLAQSIIEDYEGFVQNIDKMSESSSAFLLRGRLYQEVDSYSRLHEPEITLIPNGAENGEPQVKPIAGTTVPLTINESVEKSVAFLTQNKGRKFYQRWLERSGRWFPMMRKIAREEGVPEEIIYLSMMESGLNPNAVSRAKAVGMWQFMQSTGEMYDLKVTRWMDERRHPEKSTRAAMRHLRDLHGELGDWHLALASYNYGVNGVKRAIRKSGLEKPTFWDIQQYIPKETRNYVPLFIALTIVASSPQEYGFDLETLNFEPEHQFETVMVDESVALDVLAGCAGISVEELRSLNTELTGPSTPPNQPYELRVKPGTSNDFYTRFAILAEEEKRPWIDHAVQRRETLTSIAKKYNVLLQDLADVNGIKDVHSRLRRGAVLRVPSTTTTAAESESIALSSQTSTNPVVSAESSNNQVGETVAGGIAPTTKTESAAASTSTQLSAAADVKTVSNQSNVVAEQTGAAVAEPKRFVTHTVRSGESLSSISRQYGVRLSDLRNWNNLAIGGDNIQLGSKLVVAQDYTGVTVVNSDQSAGVVAQTTPVKKSALAATSEIKPKTIAHTVRRGETLAKIADDYGVSLQDILTLNSMKLRATLPVGKIIKILAVSNQPRNNREKLLGVVSGKPTEHKVKPGESIGIIASIYEVSEQQIRTWNPSINGNTIFAGERLKIYGDNNTVKGSSQASAKNINNPPKRYIVRRGDSLSEIAEKFGVTIASLRSKNPKIKGNTVLAGQQIRIQ